MSRRRQRRVRGGASLCEGFVTAVEELNRQLEIHPEDREPIQRFIKREVLDQRVFETGRLDCFHEVPTTSH